MEAERNDKAVIETIEKKLLDLNIEIEQEYHLHWNACWDQFLDPATINRPASSLIDPFLEVVGQYVMRKAKSMKARAFQILSEIDADGNVRENVKEFILTFFDDSNDSASVKDCWMFIEAVEKGDRKRITMWESSVRNRVVNTLRDVRGTLKADFALFGVRKQPQEPGRTSESHGWISTSTEGNSGTFLAESFFIEPSGAFFSKTNREPKRMEKRWLYSWEVMNTLNINETTLADYVVTGRLPAYDWQTLKRVISTNSLAPITMEQVISHIRDNSIVFPGSVVEALHEDMDPLTKLVNDSLRAFVEREQKKDIGQDDKELEQGIRELRNLLRSRGLLPAIDNNQKQTGEPEEKKTAGEAAIKVFVSHSSVDKNTAEAFVDLLRAALRLSAKDVRCTSVEGHKLPAGTNSDDQLRQEIFEAQAFIALLSPASIQSIYVMFELGARWGARRHLAPVMVAGLAASALKSPLSAINAISGTSPSDLHQLIQDLSVRLNVTPESAALCANISETLPTQ